MKLSNFRPSHDIARLADLRDDAASAPGFECGYTAP
jgi:hypothetical protein